MEGALPPEPTGPAQKHGQRHGESHQHQPEGEQPWCGAQRSGPGWSWNSSQHGEKGFHESSLQDKIQATKATSEGAEDFGVGSPDSRNSRQSSEPPTHEIPRSQTKTHGRKR